jgi:tetratricopeptide (TPR) repeat protein
MAGVGPGGWGFPRAHAMRPGSINGWGLFMRTMARMLFSIAVLLAATPALAYNEDRGISADASDPKLAEYYYYRGNVYFLMDRFDDNYADAYYNRGMAFDGKGLLQEALGDLRKALTSNAFSISAGKWTGEARAKIIEIQAKLSVTENLQAQTSVTSTDETLVK